MNPLVLIPLPDGRWLAMTPETLATALAEGERLIPQPAKAAVASTTELLSADEMEQRTGTPASWFLTQARLDLIPHVRLGKYVRFDLAAVQAQATRSPDLRTMNTRGARK